MAVSVITSPYRFRLMSDSQFSDALFKVQGERFHIHRSVFAARCPQLYSKLKLRLDRQRAIAIKDPKVSDSLVHPPIDRE